MRYTTEEGGRLNNFAVEPQTYSAEPPTKAEQKNYLIFGSLGGLLIVSLIGFAFYASQVAH
ncbi:MAG: ssl1498 family light-harvesting-like protein [Cyanobacteriota bacterium ELA615]|jgi:hypothetical protein